VDTDQSRAELCSAAQYFDARLKEPEQDYEWVIRELRHDGAVYQLVALGDTGIAHGNLTRREVSASLLLGREPELI
jgi:disulfide oxidoreductase YuzD